MPVRAAMDAERVEESPAQGTEATLVARGQEWIVRVEGRSITGSPSDHGATLLLLSFAKADEPEVRVLEALVAAERLEELDPPQLRGALADARPYQADWSAGGLFTGTRKARGSR